MKKLFLLAALMLPCLAKADQYTCSRVIYTGIPSNVTYPGSVQATNMVYITGTAGDVVTIDNPVGNTVDARYFFSNTTYAALVAGVTVTAMTIPHGTNKTFYFQALKYLHIYASALGVATTSFVVQVCY